MDLATAPELLEIWGYPALFVLLLLTAFGAPLPEDLLQIGGLTEAIGWVRRHAIWLIAAGLLLLAAWLVWGREESKL